MAVAEVRKKQPRTTPPVESVSSASARRFSTRNWDIRLCIGRKRPQVDILMWHMGFTPTDFIWFNGRLVPWKDAQVHVLAHGLHYGTGVFEGMRCYPTSDGPAVFRLDA